MALNDSSWFSSWTRETISSAMKSMTEMELAEKIRKLDERIEELRKRKIELIERQNALERRLEKTSTIWFDFCKSAEEFNSIAAYWRSRTQETTTRAISVVEAFPSYSSDTRALAEVVRKAREAIAQRRRLLWRLDGIMGNATEESIRNWEHEIELRKSEARL